MFHYFKNKKKIYFSRMQGFTLIELLTVMAIIGIMTAVSFPSIVNSRKRLAVKSEARRVAAVIREAQNNALSGKNADVCNIEWRFVFGIPTNKDFRIFGIPNGCVSWEEYKLEESIKFIGSGRSQFSVPMGTVTLVGPGKVTLCNESDTTICYSVCVNNAGKIEEVEGSSCP